MKKLFKPNLRINWRTASTLSQVKDEYVLGQMRKDLFFVKVVHAHELQIPGYF